ncbi:unnamed protein product [Cyberlindnera jadinii]|uniref:Uncharacterized protein n=1 Tax=Cyberlindnera jadinii (strain ATCC 18201 / CBS 1600 / BCRC 20928 / JCM 3617 / NBRC 0987 / NRRL Y-1542) TaxID=983966 RepID=A0A0H5C9R0_CYBJN|nr:hypothetical protein CYBJADRAFT_170023 [Cyberlindnera jadinii NRRL Y-1542]ODV70714.1 hypothetical protein CYBJADRAFT_170023 [Cyberlindnera jadinii NRRL Y-1542]CEP24797.1 unnamed protein product [Cyberlindnera jadinii]
MVSSSAIRSFHSSALRLNKSVASNATSRSKFTSYLFGVTVLYGAGVYLLYEFYYKNNKITKMFKQERAKTHAPHL